MAATVNTELRGLQAKARLYDELVEQLATVEDEVERLRGQHTSKRIDPAWREIANDLAEALRPYTLFREQRVDQGRIVVDSRVPGATLHKASAALERLGRQVAIESYRASGIPVPEDDEQAA